MVVRAGPSSRLRGKWHGSTPQYGKGAPRDEEQTPRVSISTVELLEAWRAAERALRDVEPGSPDEVDLTSARDDARALYRDRFDQINGKGSFDSASSRTCLNRAKFAAVPRRMGLRGSGYRRLTAAGPAISFWSQAGDPETEGMCVGALSAGSINESLMTDHASGV